ncbi:DUF4350 domain-containing protein [Gordonia sp. OPL2]|uniref:DUF4350 domain-containing protein n=1 Tax=Gordonia sp. OPL2 TaxID=2486274 RepID=UPI00165527E7|nr:DUF4350 domain-containing protein [Gordonia sp. OPL2]ROZ84373.1 DUF4350 domain-containing protein [Gordonia sp. OPL2]
MTTTATPTAPPAATGSQAPRRTALWVVIALVVVAVLTGLILMIGGTGPAPTEALDPENPGPTGTAALAAVLDDHGVPVVIARGERDLLAEPRPGPGTTVVVGATEDLGENSARTFGDRVRGADRVIVVAPSWRGLELLGLPVVTSFSSGVTDSVDARCTAPGIASDDIILRDDLGYRTIDQNVRATSCFTSDDSSALIALPATGDRPEVIVMTGAMLQNDDITRFDNAGVALRTFGRSARILWYVPSIADNGPADDAGDSDIPRAVGPLILLAFFGLLVLMFWRGRRFGPLVTEPLPVVVKAIETTQARGRMYHKARADARSAGQLRVHTTDRLARHLGLPYDAAAATAALGTGNAAPDPRVSAIIAAAARTAGRDPQQVYHLLAGPLPETPDDLLFFVTDLTALEKEVRRTP